ncbi:hypothetical protein B0H15DRAFT_830141 [Mycena belliarum]|uniref:Uncharacterized protein n=1 Tax=Mycena belliarum TaxID=1033014 RepID=A0AAD6XUV6_9AGAR|nr:hypothetical protein B0H15DRAFT_830141 [Mycena belliae]
MQPVDGPDFYNARRARWLTPTVPPRTPEPSSSRRKLEQVLSTPDAVSSDDVWFGSVEKIWKGLGAGGRLKRRLPMSLVIKIVHSAWLRDQTWPQGAVAPEPDDELPDVPPAPIIHPASATSSGISTPWTLVDDDARTIGQPPN